MQKERAQLLTVLSITFLLVLILASTMVSAGAVDDFFKQVWNSWKGGEGVPVTFAKVLFGVIVGLLVYSVLDKIPGLSGDNKAWMRGLLAVVVAFLGTAYLTTSEIYAMLLSYSGMGFALGTILPLLILVFFSYDILDSNAIRNLWVKKTLLSLLWAAYGGFILIRLISLSGTSTASVAPYTTTAMWIILGICVLAILFMGVIIRRFMRGQRQAAVEATRDITRRAAANETAQADMTEAFREHQLNRELD